MSEGKQGSGVITRSSHVTAELDLDHDNPFISSW
jgi:hypothetical protein